MKVDKFADVAVSPADLTGTESAVLLVLMCDDFIATANGKRYGLDDELLATGVVAGFSEPPTPRRTNQAARQACSHGRRHSSALGPLAN